MGWAAQKRAPPACTQRVPRASKLPPSSACRDVTFCDHVNRGSIVVPDKRQNKNWSWLKPKTAVLALWEVTPENISGVRHRPLGT